jgi:hypothetical protein
MLPPNLARDRDRSGDMRVKRRHAARSAGGNAKSAPSDEIACDYAAWRAAMSTLVGAMTQHRERHALEVRGDVEICAGLHKPARRGVAQNVRRNVDKSCVRGCACKGLTDAFDGATVVFDNRRRRYSAPLVTLKYNPTKSLRQKVANETLSKNVDNYGPVSTDLCPRHVRAPNAAAVSHAVQCPPVFANSR